MRKAISLLGSTRSFGRQTLKGVVMRKAISLLGSTGSIETLSKESS